MSLFHALQIPPPKNWQDFEELCADLWSAIYESKNTQMHGRTGQAQFGVDVYGQIGHSTEWFGVQCKGKDVRYGNAVTESELLDEVEKAKGFTPNLKMFILATTSQNDTKIQQLARELTEENQKKGLFSVEVKSWDEIHREISSYPKVIAKHYPGFNRKETGSASQSNKLSHQMLPPRASRFFFGREHELSELVISLRNESSIQVCGIGGIGKSELLLQALKKCEADRNLIWCSIDKYHSVDDLLLALLNIFRVQEEQCSVNNLPLYFDKYEVCIIFDGIEQSNLDQLEELEDIIKQWHSETLATQFIITSQVALYSFPSQKIIQLKGLTPPASRLLFEQSYGQGQSGSNKGVDDLLKFCDGHALTITFASALAKYYGSAVSVMEAINRDHSQSLSLPERVRHNRHTSLEICLRTAYSFLSPKSKKLLWALSEVPAGIFTYYLDNEWLEIEGVREAYASLKRWHFVDDIPINETISRTKMLTPVRKFVGERAKYEDPQSFEKTIGLLAQDLQILVAVFESKYGNLGDTPLLMSRYETELPNLLNIIELALAREDNKVLSKIAGFIASAIMPYYFVLGVPEVGAKMLKSSVELALKTSNIKKANDLLQQFICLSERARDNDLLTEASELLERIETAANGGDICPELSLTKALIASTDSLWSGHTRNLAAEKYARDAIDGFRLRLEDNAVCTDEMKAKKEVLHNELSHSLGLLGTSLLNQNKPDKALEAYYSSLELQGSSFSGVNRGQTLHQIGLCESELGNYESAIEHFSMAADIFIYTGMKDYISHSFAELGYNLLDIDVPKIHKQFSEESIHVALLDLMQYTVQTFDTCLPLKHQMCKYNFRKLTGTFFLLSLIGQGDKLRLFVRELGEKTIPTLKNLFESGNPSKNDRITAQILILILDMGDFISSVDHTIGSDLEHGAISDLLRFICEIDGWLDDRSMRITDWLAVYFTRRLGSKDVDSDRLKKFIWNYNNDVKDTLDLFSY